MSPPVTLLSNPQDELAVLSKLQQLKKNDLTTKKLSRNSSGLINTVSLQKFPHFLGRSTTEKNARDTPMSLIKRRSTLGRCTFTATSRPVRNRARCTFDQQKTGVWSFQSPFLESTPNQKNRLFCFKGKKNMEVGDQKMDFLKKKGLGS